MRDTNGQKYAFIRMKRISVTIRFYDHIPKRFLSREDKSKDYLPLLRKADFGASAGNAGISIDLSKSI